MPGALTDALAWLVVAAFVAGAVADRIARRRATGSGDPETTRAARLLSAGAWALFALFWLLLVPHFAFEQKSFVEGLLCLAAVPACLSAGSRLLAGRDSLFVLSRAVAAMGLIYLPFETIPALTVAGTTLPAPRGVLMETVAAQTGTLMNALGYHPELIRGSRGYLNTYRFVTAGGHRLEFSVILACTGVGSMAIFGGLVAAVRAPLRRKLRALAASIPIIYGLNLLRTTFIGIAFGTQSLQLFVDEVLFLFGASDAHMVSFFLSDRVISQVLAVVALVGVTYLVVRELPELLVVVEDALYVLTRREYDLAEALDVPRSDADAGPRPRRAD